MTTTVPALTIPKKRRIFSRWRIALAILLAVGVTFYLFQPQLSAWALRNWLPSQAKKQQHLIITLGKVEADFFSGRIALGNTTIVAEGHPESKAEIGLFDLNFSPWRFLFRREQSDQPGKNIVREIHLEKVKAHWDLRAPKSKAEKGQSHGEASRFGHQWFPQKISGSSVTVAVTWPGGTVNAEEMEFDFHPDSSGTIGVPKLTVTTPKIQRSFSALEGVTALKGRALYLGGIKFADTVELERAAIDFSEIDRAQVTSDTQFQAFGGQVRTDSRWDLRKTSPFLDSAALFWNVSVDQVGAFLGNQTFASGTIHEGRFSFRGNPGDAANATITLRLNATEFRWKKRRWDSLVASALLVNHRLEIPQFSLVQNKNQIEMNGNLEMPPNWRTMPAQFQLNIQAQLDDLAAAAAIIAPDQKVITGEAFFAGTLSNQKGQFAGKLKMRGGPLTLSGVAIDRVRGDLDLLGADIQATNLALVHRDDWAAGSATFSLGEQQRYSGKFEVNAQNIADYRAILPLAISEHAFAGGVHLWWSGDGGKGAHSGAFRATLNDFILSRVPEAVPLDAETDGSYSPGGITLNHLRLARPQTKLDAVVAVRPESLELRDLKITGRAGAKLEGNIELPVNILKALNDPTVATLLNSTKNASGKITAGKIHLEDLAELSGRRWPVRGLTSFEATVYGAWPEFKLDATGKGQDLSFPSPDLNGEKVNLDSFSGKLHVADHRLEFSVSAVPDATAKLDVSGNFGVKTDVASLAQNRILDPSAPLAVTAAGKDFSIAQLHPWIPASRAFAGRVNGQIEATGTPESPALSGNLQIANGTWTADFLPAPVKRLAGDFDFGDQIVAMKDVAGEYRGGKFSVQGRGSLSPAADIALDIQASNIPLTPSEGFEAVADGKVSLSGPGNARKLEGAVTLKKAVTRRSFGFVKSPSPFRLPWTPESWAVNLKVVTEGPLSARALTFDSKILYGNQEWKLFPNITITGTSVKPRFRGMIEGSLINKPYNWLIYYSDVPFEQGFAGFLPTKSNTAGAGASNDGKLWNVSSLFPFLPDTPLNLHPEFAPAK